MTLSTELERFPLTGRFMASRLRHAMTDYEKSLLEGQIEEVRETQGETQIIARRDFCDHSTMLIDGFMLRTIHENGDRSIVGFQVPGDFVDLHGFALKRLDHDLCAPCQTVLVRDTLGCLDPSRVDFEIDEAARGGAGCLCHHRALVSSAHGRAR